MKNLLTVFAFALLGTGAFAQSDADFNVLINGETSREQLSEIRTQLKEKGFDFRYNPSFDQDRKLVRIEVVLTEIDGTLEGNFKANGLQEGQSLRMVRNTAEGAAVPFCVGNCPEQ